ncbi:MAG: cupin domain-containing protein [Asticcacaulis sp.]
MTTISSLADRCAGQIHLIENDANNIAIARAQPACIMNDVPDMQFQYGVAVSLPAHGLSVAHGRVEAGAHVPPHSGPNPYALYVISGAGILTLTTADTSEVRELPFKAGDILLFEPDTQHGWVNTSSEAFVWFGVDVAPKAST